MIISVKQANLRGNSNAAYLKKTTDMHLSFCFKELFFHVEHVIVRRWTSFYAVQLSL